jgi:hypothetical protein
MLSCTVSVYRYLLTVRVPLLRIHLINYAELRGVRDPNLNSNSK